MKKILFVQVPTSHLGAGEKVYPLGLSRLSALAETRLECRGLDLNLHPDPWPELDRVLTGFNPDITALSFRNLDPLAGHQASYLSCLQTAARLTRIRLPGTRILAGGPAFSLFAGPLMERVPEIDAGIVGEGEQTFPLLLADPFRPDIVPGTVFRENGRIRQTKPGPKTGMDDLPRVNTRLFPPQDYTRGNAYVAAMGIEGKRGCDLACGYCLYPFLGGARMRLRSPRHIADEMEQLHRESGQTLFHLTDPVVNRPADHFEALCRELIQRDLGLSWTGFFREDSLTRSGLDLAAKAGLCAVYFSGDALSRHGLALLNKRLEIDDILRATRITADHGILTMCHFLVNLPGETDDTVRESRETLDRLLDIHGSAGNLGAVIFNTVRLYPGAPLTRRLIRSGDLAPDLDLLYPVYHNPARFNHLLHEMEAACHTAGVFSRLGIHAKGT